MTLQEFDKLLQRYLKGQCTLEEEQRIEKWYASYDKDPSDVLEEHQKILVENRLRRVLNVTPATSSNQRFLTLPYISGIAASVLLLILSVWWVNYDVKETIGPIKSIAKIERVVSNSTQGILLHVLTDGSTAALQPGSEIRYHAERFSDSRDVQLIGEAFFEVKKDKDHPFLVYTGGLITKVLGTSFNVSARKDVKEIVVSVKTGKVSVFTQQGLTQQNAITQEVILTPNQTAIYDTFSEKVVKGLVTDGEKATSAPARKIHFANASILEIFEVLGDQYGIQINLDNADLSACKITTTLADESLFEKLDIICQAIGADYEVIEATVLIEGEGCN